GICTKAGSEGSSIRQGNRQGGRPLRIRVEELATAYGNNYKHVTFDKATIKDIVQKFAVKSDGGKGLNGTGSKPGTNIGYLKLLE
ncbi:hypothetical protein, partial [Peribacillus simplex]|uniref:hypothetical protein n=1 Tax=Peribacillus simplex TaxID=1478 RepID=UPI00148550B6